MKIERKLIARLAATLLALPILYIAASGPLLRVNLGQPARPFLETFYRPLDDITIATQTNGLWRKYLQWWGGYYRLQVYDLSPIPKGI
jgi:hypothetical protein